MALIFDLETDGLLDEVSKIHCIVIKETDINKVYTFHGANVEYGIKKLMAGLECGDVISGHNVIKYDIPVIKKLYPWFTVD